MNTKTRKRNYTGRNTGMFYALIAQLPGYTKEYKDLIKEGIINEFHERVHGRFHKRNLSLSGLSDIEYHELIRDLRQQVYEGKSRVVLQQEAVRKSFISQILKAFSKIGVNVTNGDYSNVNYHVRRLPISKGRIIPQFRFDELEKLLGAVRSYCDNIHKQQLKEQILAPKN